MTKGLTPTPGLPAEAHISAILQAYSLKRADLLGPSKHQDHCVPRRELFARLICEPFKFCGGEPVYRSLPLAGKIVGRRDHSTVFYGLRKWAAEHLGTPPKAKVAQIRAAYIARPQEIAA
jgi:chromosomal replication initiation ATPase DnaA